MDCRIIVGLIQLLVSFVEHIDGTRNTENTGLYFKENTQYRYSYTSSVESAFIGTIPSKSGFKYTCNIRLDIHTGYQSVLQIEDCKVYKRLREDKESYETFTADFTSVVARYPVYFTFEENNIKTGSILIHQDDPLYSVNVKRGILSALQFQLLPADKKQKKYSQVDIFGHCPVQYNMYDHEPDSVFTSRDLTLCTMPQVFKLQMRFFSVIKKLHGGHEERKTDEPIYPFGSTVDCEYRLTDSVVQSVECLQQQSFKPTAYNGSIYATALSGIKQSFSLMGATPLENGDSIEVPTNVKNVSILFEIPEEEKVTVSKETLDSHLHTLVNSYTDKKLIAWPEQFHDLVWFMKHSTQETLQRVLVGIFSCHGNTDGSCDQKKKTIEEEYFIDGLLSCATDSCINLFTKCMKEGHVSWLTSRHFLYDLAINHQPTEETALLILDMCKKSDSISCWLPLSIMINKLYLLSTVQSSQKEGGAIIKTLSTLHNSLQNIQQNGDEMNPVEAKDTLRILKAIRNVGKALQVVYDVDNKLMDSILQLTDKKYPYRIVKAALQILEIAEMTSVIRDKLEQLTSDVDRVAIVRTMSFSILMRNGGKDIIQKLINMLHTEPMTYMRDYMVSSVKELLENDQPDMKGLRDDWQKALQADGRALPELDEWLYRHTRYMELSRYFQLPFSMTFYGVQLEFDLVYDPSMHLIQSTVIRLNYYIEKKYNLLEVTADNQGLEPLLDAIFDSKGKGLYHFLSYLAQAKRNLEKGVNPQFANFDKKLSEALNKIVKLVNHPQFSLPEDTLTWKLYGYEVMYVEISDIVSMVTNGIGTLLKNRSGQKPRPTSTQSGQQQDEQSKRRKQQGGLISKVIRMLSKGYRLVKTRSANVVDLTKIMPTLSGATINMTVLMTTSMGLEGSVKGDFTQYLRGIGPLLAIGDFSVGFASEFFGQMSIDLGGQVQAGMRMVTNMNIKAETENSMALKKGMTTLANYTVQLKKKNIEGNFNLAQARSRLYHFHGEWDEIPVDKSVQKEVKKCTGIPMMLMTGNTVCARVTYPDVKNSKTHAYFPLSGPVNADVIVSRTDRKMNEFSFEANYLITNGTDGPVKMIHFTYSAPGERLKRQIDINIDQSLVHDTTVAEMKMPETGARFQYENRNLKKENEVENESVATTTKKIHILMKNLTMFKAVLQTEKRLAKEDVFDYKQRKMVIGNKTNVITLLSLAGPHISLDVNFTNDREKLSTHINTKFHMKYYCAKHYPILYNVHVKPHLAAANGDISEISFQNDVEMGYKVVEDAKLWSAQDRMLFVYPGQKFTLSNDMLANLTHAHRKTVITYIGVDNTEEVIEMNAHVRNESDSSSSHFCYQMSLEHQDKYDVDLKGHFAGSLRSKLNIQTDVSFKKKEKLQTNGHPDDSTALVTKRDNHVCSIFTMDEWNMKLNFTVDTKPVFVPGERRPEGMEFLWDLGLSYPSCNEQGQIISKGAIGRNLKNSVTNFKYWLKTEAVTSLPSYKNSRKYDINFKAAHLYNKYQEFICQCQTPYFNFSYTFTEVKNATGEITMKALGYMESPWKILNFNYEGHVFVVINGFLKMEQSLEAKCVLGNVELNSTFLIDDESVSFQQEGYVIVKHHMLAGRTNISASFTLSKVSKLGASVVLSRNHECFYIDVTLKSPWVIDTVFSVKKNQHYTKHVYLTSEMAGSTMVKETFKFNPKLTHTIFPVISMKLRWLSRVLQHASNILSSNLDKPIPAMVVPFVNKTVAYYMKKIVVPVMSYLPLPPNVKRIVDMSLQRNRVQNSNIVNGSQDLQDEGKGLMYFGQTLVKLMMKIESKLLGYVSKVLIEPPYLVNHMFQKYVKPSLHQAIKTNTISFTYPVLLKWKNFVSFPSLTTGQQHLKGFIESRIYPSKASTSVSTALLYENNEVLTFDGKVYQITDESTCPYLLTADAKHANFAVLSSKDGISVVTKKSMVTIHPGGQVFINGCNRPVELPYSSEDLTVTKKNVSRVITLDVGLTVSCDINTSHCNFALNGHHNQTIGLFGNNDLEIGNEFKIPLGHFTPNIKDFVKKYELELSGSCKSPAANLLSQVQACEDLRRRCDAFFSNIESPLAMCFIKVDSKPFLASCKERVKTCMPDSICPPIHAYISKCDLAGVAINPTNELDTCDVFYPLKIAEPSKALLDIIILLYKDAGDDFCLPCIETLIRYLQTCDKTDVKLTFIQFNSKNTTVKEALEIAAQHTFRSHSQKMVIIIKNNQDINEEEYKILKALYLEANIMLNVVSKYRVLRYKGLVALDWDGRVVSLDNILDDSLDLPQESLIKLMTATKGSLFNAMLLQKDRKTRMEGLVKHVCQRQAYSTDNC